MKENKLQGPDFVVAGGHKCATTTLHEVLDRHPELQMSSVKEPHYLVRRECQSRLRSGVWDSTEYETLWERDGVALRGESSVLYLSFADEFVESACTELARPPKVIVIVRDPVERAVSSFFDVRLKNPLEDAASFEEAVEREIERGAWRLDGEGSPTMRHLALGIYSTGIRTLQRTLGARNVHLVLFDDLVTDMNGALASIEQFLGVEEMRLADSDGSARNVGRRSWRGGPIDTLAKTNAAVSLRRSLRRLSPGLHERLGTQAVRHLTKDAEPVLPATRRLLNELYEPEISKLRELVGDRGPWLSAG